MTKIQSFLTLILSLIFILMMKVEFWSLFGRDLPFIITLRHRLVLISSSDLKELSELRKIEAWWDIWNRGFESFSNETFKTVDIFGFLTSCDGRTNARHRLDQFDFIKRSSTCGICHRNTHYSYSGQRGRGRCYIKRISRKILQSLNLVENHSNLLVHDWASPLVESWLTDGLWAGNYLLSLFASLIKKEWIVPRFFPLLASLSDETEMEKTKKL